MTSRVSALAGSFAALRRDRPEWTAWLHVAEILHAQVETSLWDTSVPQVDGGSSRGQPLLAGAVLSIEAGALDRVVDCLVVSANEVSAKVPPRLSSGGPDDRLALFTASIADEPAHLASLLSDDEAGLAVAGARLLAVPFLHACRRHYEAEATRGWLHAYCPICGAWPSFVEMRGIERARHARCGRCGAGWHSTLLRCPYCAATDHLRLLTLQPEGDVVTGTVDACQDCGRYTKTLTTLQPYASLAVYAADLATAELDIAALSAGYVRPGGLAVPLAVTAGLRPAVRTWWRT